MKEYQNRNGQQDEKLTGIFRGTARGFGFVSLADRKDDIFIGARDTCGAFDGDEVEIMITRPGRAGKSQQGRVLRVIKRNTRKLVGVYQKKKDFGFVVPGRQGLCHDIFISKDHSMKAGDGQVVECLITDYGGSGKSPEGRIIDIIGSSKDPAVDGEKVLRAYQIPLSFPPEVDRQIREIPDHVLEEELTGRRDLRELMTVTIDGEDARDLDDAITLSREADGWLLGVHIADVSHYVREGSPLDREALERGTSVYLPGSVVHMLPRRLSNGICSLNEGEDRLALSCLMKIDAGGHVVDHEIVESVINVNHRMSYTQVSALLEDADLYDGVYDDAADMFRDMDQAARLLRSLRRRRGGIDFDFPESSISLDEKGFPTEIKPYERNEAARIIEDFMLAANETIAEDCYWQDIPFLYRSHEAPDGERIRRLGALLRGFGLYLHTKKEKIHPKEFQQLLGRIEGTPAEAMISRLVLRSMKRARYTTENLGHFGLAVSNYCHFTSPIRRYPDLQIHRIIKERLHGKLDEERTQHYRRILPGVAEQTSRTERRADDVERDVEKIKKAEYMTGQICTLCSGIISGITSRGIYVELENTCEGLVKFESMKDFYVYDEKTLLLTGESFGKVFYLGQPVSVYVDDVDLQTSTVLFHLKGELGGAGKRRKKGNVQTYGSKKRPQTHRK